MRAGSMGIVGACDLAAAAQGGSVAFTKTRTSVAPAMISLTTLDIMDPRHAALLEQPNRGTSRSFSKTILSEIRYRWQPIGWKERRPAGLQPMCRRPAHPQDRRRPIRHRAPALRHAAPTRPGPARLTDERD